MADIKPTRSELIKLKNRIKLAKSGYNLLKKKRDGLIMDFFDILKSAKSIRGELVDSYKEAKKRSDIARVMEGDMQLKSISLAVSQKPEVIVNSKNIMGVVVPTISSENVEKKNLERGWSAYTSSSVDEAAEAYEKVVEKIISAAEYETAMKKLLIEIEKTKRRVNALEFSVIPSLEGTQNFIRLRLEEMERENVFRLKRIK